MRFRALATDFDGTLADGGTADPDALVAMARARLGGLRVVLVTGRILSELLVVFPDVFDHVDSVVAENGAVLATRSGSRQLHGAVDDGLVPALVARGVQARQGRVIVACSGLDEPIVVEVVRDLGLECELLRNRHELMILPTGVTKGSGLVEALAELGVSPHDTIAVGDAENDHSLIDAVEVGVAVANAVPSLAHHADLVLDRADGGGVAQLLDGDIVGGAGMIHSACWQLELGVDPDGVAVTIPASRVNVLIAGGTGGGKSWVAGLLCEQLVRQRYAVVVIDPEGDHAGLAELPDVTLIGGDHVLLPPPGVLYLVDHRCGTVVIDLSALDEPEQDEYLRTLASEMETHRSATGLPHWLVLDEAHRAIGRTQPAAEMFDPSTRGNCLVSWHPEDLSAAALAAADVLLVPTEPGAGAELVDLAAAVAAAPRAEVVRALRARRGSLLVARRDEPGRVRVADLARRSTSHFRHDHKYGLAGVGIERAFHFRDDKDHLTGAIARSLSELETELHRCPASTLRHHLPRHDLSRWVAEVFHDPPLADALHDVEDRFGSETGDPAMSTVRADLVRSLRQR